MLLNGFRSQNSKTMLQEKENSRAKIMNKTKKEKKEEKKM
jgi:hypothetical protein